MPARKQPRRIARELAILGLSHLSRNEAKLSDQLLHDFLWAAIQTLTTEARELLETAATEIRRARTQFKSGHPLSPAERQSAQVAANEGLSLAETALERIGYALDLPEFTQIARQQDVREYAIELLTTVHRRKADIQACLNAALVNWALDRLPQLDRHILMLAIAEIMYLNVPERVAINEAIELAKQYSDDEGARFINGVLRRVSNNLKNPPPAPSPKATTTVTPAVASPETAPEAPPPKTSHLNRPSTKVLATPTPKGPPLQISEVESSTQAVSSNPEPEATSETVQPQVSAVEPSVAERSSPTQPEVSTVEPSTAERSNILQPDATPATTQPGGLAVESSSLAASTPLADATPEVLEMPEVPQPETPVVEPVEPSSVAVASPAPSNTTPEPPQPEVSASEPSVAESSSRQPADTAPAIPPPEAFPMTPSVAVASSPPQSDSGSEPPQLEASIVEGTSSPQAELASAELAPDVSAFETPEPETSEPETSEFETPATKAPEIKGLLKRREPDVVPEPKTSRPKPIKNKKVIPPPKRLQKPQPKGETIPHPKPTSNPQTASTEPPTTP